MCLILTGKDRSSAVKTRYKAFSFSPKIGQAEARWSNKFEVFSAFRVPKTRPNGTCVVKTRLTRVH